MEISFTDLKEKEVINIVDGKKLGRIVDVVFSVSSGVVKGVIVPGEKKIFRKSEDIFLALNQVKKIGGDVILVNLKQQVQGGIHTQIDTTEYDYFNTQRSVQNKFLKVDYDVDGQKTRGVNKKNLDKNFDKNISNNQYSNQSFVRYKRIDNKKYKWLAKRKLSVYHSSKRKDLWNVFIVVQKKVK